MLLSASSVRADGGALRLRETAGNYQIAIFTSPTPFRVGTVDVSVLVQDVSGESVPEVRATVRLTARATRETLESLATSDAATNKLFQAAVFVLPEAGWWDVEVAVEGPRGSAAVRFGIEAEAPLPRWVEMWPWLALPVVVVGIFCMHQVLVRRRTRQAGSISDRSGVQNPRDSGR